MLGIRWHELRHSVRFFSAQQVPVWPPAIPLAGRSQGDIQDTLAGLKWYWYLHCTQYVLVPEEQEGYASQKEGFKPQFVWFTPCLFGI